MEAETALRGLASRFPGLRLARPEEEPRRHGVLIARGLDDLPVEVHE